MIIGALCVTVVGLVPLFLERAMLIADDRKKKKKQKLRERKVVESEDRLTVFEDAIDILKEVDQDGEISRLVVALRMSSSQYSRNDSIAKADVFYSDLQNVVDALDEAGYEDYSRFLLEASASFDQLQKVRML